MTGRCKGCGENVVRWKVEDEVYGWKRLWLHLNLPRCSFYDGSLIS